jgi:hypothetical protein
MEDDDDGRPRAIPTDWGECVQYLYAYAYVNR